MSSRTKTEPFDLSTLKSHRCNKVQTVHGKVGSGISWHIINSACETASQGIGTIYIQCEMRDDIIFERASRLGYNTENVSCLRLCNPYQIVSTNGNGRARISHIQIVQALKEYVNTLEFEVHHICMDANWMMDLTSLVLEAFPDKMFTIGIKVY